MLSAHLAVVLTVLASLHCASAVVLPHDPNDLRPLGRDSASKYTAVVRRQAASPITAITSIAPSSTTPLALTTITATPSAPPFTSVPAAAMPTTTPSVDRGLRVPSVCYQPCLQPVQNLAMCNSNTAMCQSLCSNDATDAITCANCLVANGDHNFGLEWLGTVQGVCMGMGEALLSTVLTAVETTDGPWTTYQLGITATGTGLTIYDTPMTTAAAVSTIPAQGLDAIPTATPTSGALSKLDRSKWATVAVVGVLGMILVS